MNRKLVGVLDGKGRKFALVVSRFNELVTGRLLDGARDCLLRHGVEEENILSVWVPGALEIPPVAAKLAENGKVDAVVCLGAVVRGDTPHFDYVAGQSSKGLAQLALEADIPVINGILTCETVEQALDRAGAKAGNRGWQAALTGLEMVNLYRALEEK